MLKCFKFDEMVAGMWIFIIFKHDFVEYGTTCNVNALIIYLCLHQSCNLIMGICIGACHS